MRTAPVRSIMAMTIRIRAARLKWQHTAPNKCYSKANHRDEKLAHEGLHSTISEICLTSATSGAQLPIFAA